MRIIAFTPKNETDITFAVSPVLAIGTLNTWPLSPYTVGKLYSDRIHYIRSSVPVHTSALNEAHNVIYGK